jgi:hypothetical protein
LLELLEATLVHADLREHLESVLTKAWSITPAPVVAQQDGRPDLDAAGATLEKASRGDLWMQRNLVELEHRLAAGIQP